MTIVNPAAIPFWCAAHGGCPSIGVASEPALAPAATETVRTATRKAEAAQTDRKPGFVPCP